MARPTLIRVQGKFLKVDGTPETGAVYFRSKISALSSTLEDSTVQVPSVKKVELVDGYLDAEVPATNDPEWTPSSWTYEIHFRFSEGITTSNHVIPYDAPEGIFHVSQLVPVAASTGNIYAAYNHTHAGGGDGSSADPATTVVAETAYGQTSAVGVGLKYARHDHSHGTPALPTPAAIGAANTSHAHSAADITSGTLPIGRIPTGTSGTTVALGNDSRFTDSRTPSAHAASHADGGSDEITISQAQVTNLATDLDDIADDLASLVTNVSLKAPLASPTFSGTVSGVSKAMVGLGNADNTSDATKNSAAVTLSNKTLASPAFTGTPTGLTKSHVGLGSVDNTADADKPVSTAVQAALDLKASLTALDAKAPLASPTFTGTVSGITKAMVGLGSVDNTADSAKPVSTAQQSALDLKAPLASPTFSGTVSGISKAMVGLGSVDNTADSAKPVSTAQQTALDLKAPLASPTFTGTVSGITKSMVGLGSVDNTADTAKPVSTAQQTALNLKANLASPTFTGTVAGITKAMVGLTNVDNTADTAKPVSTAQQTALDGKPDIYSWNGSAYVLVTTGDIYIGPNDPGAVGNGSVWIDTTP
jgi:hypothetical protein